MATIRCTDDVKLPKDALTAGLLGKSGLSRRIRRAEMEEARAAKFAKEFSGWLVPSLTRCCPEAVQDFTLVKSSFQTHIFSHHSSISNPHSLSLSTFRHPGRLYYVQYNVRLIDMFPRDTFTR
jgi:hypothetical protein